MDYYNYDYRDHDRWRSENQGQYHYDNNLYDNGCYYDECYVDNSYETYDNGYYESCENDCGWIDYSAQNHYYEPPYSSETQGSLNESSDGYTWEQMRDMQEDTSRRLLNMQEKLDELIQHFNLSPPPEDLLDTMEVSEVSSLSSNEFFDNKVHEPTLPEVEMVVEDCVSLDEKDKESVFEFEEVVNDLENCNENLHDLETSKVGEGFVEDNTTPNPTDLKANKKEHLVVMETKRPVCFKQPNVVINRPLLSTIYIQNSWRDCTIDVTFGDHKLRLLLFEHTNHPPMSGDLVVVNTIDDHVYEHTANMLSDTAHNLENCLACFRSNSLDFCGSKKVKKKFPNKKHDSSHAHKSKMKVFYGIKHQSKEFNRRKDLWVLKIRFKCSHGRFESKRFGLYKVNESMPFDPGGSHVTYDPP